MAAERRTTTWKAVSSLVIYLGTPLVPGKLRICIAQNCLRTIYVTSIHSEGQRQGESQVRTTPLTSMPVGPAAVCL